MTSYVSKYASFHFDDSTEPIQFEMEDEALESLK